MTMKRSLFRVLLWLVICPFLGISSVIGQVDQLIPKPQKIELETGELMMKLEFSTLDSLANLIWRDLNGANHFSYLNNRLRIGIVETLEGIDMDSYEAYILKISDDGITIDARSSKGVFYAIQTLKQLGIEKSRGQIQFPFTTITDWPAFPIRGFMHDVGRSFIPIEELKEQIRILSGYKINVFHWHLTEDIAWRLESEIFPQLISPSNQERFPGLYYTKEDVRELLDLARSRNVTVIPEIDIPGHSAAFRRALGLDMQSADGKEALKKLLEEAGDLFEGSPYFHLGTDEVKFTDPDFVPEMVAFVRGLGFQVVSWNPGWDYQEGEIDLLQLWSYRGAKNGNIPVIDSRFHYINHFDPFADLISLFRSNVLGESSSDGVVQGSILATWNDRALVDSESILRENNFYSLMLAFSERLWRGGGDGYFSEVGVRFPSEPEQIKDWLDFENRLLTHKEKYFEKLPFPYYRQSELVWNLVHPQPNKGKLDSVFQIERELLSDNGQNVSSEQVISARGGTVYLRHVWGDLVPANFEDPQPNSTAYSYTYIFSPFDQTIEAWISFQDYSRSEKDMAPENGKWDYKGSQIWVNRLEVLPPDWENQHKVPNSDIPLKNENVQSREPTSIHLKKGWNKVVMRLPVGEFTLPEVRLVKWMFTFVPLNGEGLVFSIEKSSTMHHN